MNKKPVYLISLTVAIICVTTAYAETFSARGLVKAKSRAVLASEIGAVVNKTPFRSGDTFKKGDALIVVLIAAC